MGADRAKTLPRYATISMRFPFGEAGSISVSNS